jgi:hypothetical protein
MLGTNSVHHATTDLPLGHTEVHLTLATQGPTLNQLHKMPCVVAFDAEVDSGQANPQPFFPLLPCLTRVSLLPQMRLPSPSTGSFEITCLNSS